MGFDWLSWLGNLIKLVGELIPQREKIPPTHRGLKYVGMTKVKTLQPGCYWYWPWRTEIHQLCIAQQTLWLEEQDVMTADGRSVKLRGTVTYRLRDDPDSLMKAGVRTWDIRDQIDDEAMAVYCAFVSCKTGEDIHQHRETVNKELTTLVRKRLKEYGVYVVRAQLTSFSTGIPLLHIGSK